MEGYPNLSFKLQNERVSVYKLWAFCGSNVRPRQEALQCDQCSVAAQIMQHW